MLQQLKTVPNLVTGVRMLLIPMMWVCAFLELSTPIGIGMFLAGLTDYLDGWLARKLKQHSDIGARFDALADNVLIPSAVAWLAMLYPEMFTGHPVLTALAFGVYLAAIVLGVVKFRQVANLHLYSTRFAGVVQYIFIITTFLMGGYTEWLFILAMGLWCISAAEMLLLQIVCREVNEHMGSLALVLLERRDPGLAHRIRSLLKRYSAQ